MRRHAALLACLPFLAPGMAAAQGTASIQAVANVSTIALSAGFVQELDFGVVVAGAPTTIDPRSGLAGAFVIHGTRNAEIQVTITLPAALTLGGSSMPIAFGPNAGCHRNRNQLNNCTYFDPAAPLIVRIRNQNPPDNHYWVWIGGTVTPAPAQPGGTYAGNITLTAAYTGN